MHKILEFNQENMKPAYNLQIGKSNEELLNAYIQVDLKTKLEHLILERSDGMKTIVYSSKYIYSPIFAGNNLVFSAFDEDENCQLYVTDLLESKVVRKLTHSNGRIKNIRVQNHHVDHDIWIAYEKRDGKISTTYGAFYDGKTWHVDIVLSDEINNAYDPHIAKSIDAYVYAIYSCFIFGNYHIMLQKLDGNGAKLGNAVRVSDCLGASFWPSVSLRQDGGIWITYTGLTGVGDFQETYLRHDKYNSIRTMFTYDPEIYVGIYIDDQLYCMDNKNDWYNPLAVDHAIGKYSNVFETGDHRLVITYRAYDKDTTNSAGISYILINGDTVSQPNIISRHAQYEGYVSSIELNNDLHIGYEENNRNTGWNIAGEWFDYENTIELTIDTITFNDDTITEIPLKPYYTRKTPIASIEQAPYTRVDMEEGKKLVWGQTHAHTDISICQRATDQNADFNYRFTQDVQKSDFAAVTDHAYNQWGIDTHINHKHADFYYFKGQFVTFPAYEWTGTNAFHEGGPFGHVNPLYLEEDGTMDFYTPVDEHCDGATLNKLWEAYKGKKIITVPHHTANKEHPYNWAFHNEGMVPIVEIFQDVRGQYEQEGMFGTTADKKGNKASYVLEALKRGYKLGFIGGADHSGIARGGVLVKDLTRNALYEAMMSRNTIASSGTGADIRFSCNGHDIGSIIVTDEGLFNIEISTNDDIDLVQIVHNGHTIEEHQCSGKLFNYGFKVERQIDNDFWYVRIQLKNGELFWTSPIWLTNDAGRNGEK